MEKTLFRAYYEQKIGSHFEPQREGIKRGEKIGFSKQKFTAALLVGLAAHSLKEVAEKVEVSYGLLRQWNMDREFRDIAENTCKEFAGSVVALIKAKVEQAHTHAKEKKVYLEDILNKEKFEELSDAKIYSDCVIREIGQLYLKHFHTSSDLFEANIFGLLFISRKIFPGHYKEWLRTYILRANEYFKNPHLCNILLPVGGLDPDDRIALKIFLDHLEEFLK